MRELEDALLLRDREIVRLRDVLEYFRRGERRRREYKDEDNSKRMRRRRASPSNYNAPDNCWGWISSPWKVS